MHRERMLRKPEQSSTRIVGGRIARVLAGAVLSGLLGPLAFAAQASALGSGAGTLGSVSGSGVGAGSVPVVSRVAGSGVAPVSGVVARSVPAVSQVAGSTVAPVTRAGTPTGASGLGTLPGGSSPSSPGPSRALPIVGGRAPRLPLSTAKPIVGGRAPRLPLSAAKPIGGGGESASTMPVAEANGSPVHGPLVGDEESGGPGGPSPAGGSSGSHGPRSGAAGIGPGSGSLPSSSPASPTIASLGALLATGASR